MDVNDSGAQTRPTTRDLEDQVALAPQHLTPESVGLHTLPAQVRHVKARHGSAFNLMVAGRPDLGKTTFLNTLLGDAVFPPRDAPAFVPGFTTEVQAVHTILTENSYSLRFTAIDTPGFGSAIDNTHAWTGAAHYIDQCTRQYMFQEEQPRREGMVDNRVHCCLYFLGPSVASLLPLDTLAMKELSKRVNLIPVVAMCDGLRPLELQLFKKLVRATVRDQQIALCEHIPAGEVLTKILATVPFAVIGAQPPYLLQAGDGLPRGRVYPWGTAEVDNEHHCDFAKLRRVLVLHHMLDLIDAAEAHYERCRTYIINYRLREVLRAEVAGGSAKLLRAKGLAEAGDHEHGGGSAGTASEADEVAVLCRNTANNGLLTMQTLQHFLPAKVEAALVETHPQFRDLQHKLQQEFAAAALHHAARWKPMKRALIEKQEAYNKDIDELHARVVALTAEVQRMQAASASSEGGEGTDVCGTVRETPTPGPASLGSSSAAPHSAGGRSPAHRSLTLRPVRLQRPDPGDQQSV